jgi:hypothetical protein
MEYRTTMEHLSPSTINVRMSAIRKLIGEARRNGMIGREEADNLIDIPNVRQKGAWLGNWLTREQAALPTTNAMDSASVSRTTLVVVVRR